MRKFWVQDLGRLARNHLDFQKKITQDDTVVSKLASDVEGRGLGLECSPDAPIIKDHEPNNIGGPGSGREPSPCVGPVLENSNNTRKEVVAPPGLIPHLNSHSNDEQHYSLRWNDFQASILTSFRHLRDQEDFVDVTLACEGRSFTAHKVVLSACSSYFRHLLKANPCQHPIVILRDVLWRDMEALLQFMYHGEVSVSQEQLTGVLHAARTLQIKGLADLPGKQFSKPASEYSGSGSSRASSPARRGRLSPPPSRKRPRVEIHEFPQNGGPPSLTLNHHPGLKTDAGDEDKNADSHSLLSQALEGRSPSLMAHLLATRSQLEVTSHYGNARNHEHGAGHHDEAGSDSEDSEASDRERSDANDFPKSESGDYGEEGYGHVNDRQLPPELLPPPGYTHPLLNLQGLHSLFPGPSGLQNSGQELSHARRSLDLMRIRATDPRPCPQCGKIYRSAHTLRTHLEDKHTVCPGYRCVLCGTVAKSRNSLHSHMSRQHRGISTKDLPVLPMPSPFDPVLASCLLAKAGVKISPAELAARASPTSGNPRGRTADLRLELKSPGIPPTPTVGGLQSHRSSLALAEDVSSFDDYNAHRMMRRLERDRDERERERDRGDRERDRERSRSLERSLHPYGSSSVINVAGSSQRGPKSSKTMQNLSQTVAADNWMEAGGGGGPPSGPAVANAAMAAAAAAAGAGTGSALLDTYLQLIAEHSAAAAAAAAAANQGGHPSRRLKGNDDKMDYQSENEGGRDRERRSPARAESGR